MKQLIKTTILLLALLLPVLTYAHDFKVDGIYYNINGNEAEVTHGKDIYSRYHGAVPIPASVTYNGTTYPVTSIGQQAFARCSALTSVEIPNSVTSIGRWAFTECTGLTGIVVESGNATFDSRDNSNAIIETFSNTLIVGCKNTTIPNSVTAIGDEAFANNSGLTSIDIPNSVTSIGHQAFVYCSGLTRIDIPNSVTEIGMLAFAECTGLTCIVVENGNPRYDSRDNCNAIIETADNTLFLGCKNTIIPNTVTAIGDRAFAYCHGLTSLDIPNSVTAIGDQAFDSCDGLTSLDIPN
ncbi:MAG: leucine-rich repeat domain-containing protein, partial [Muribaculaceae bacterium]|nr:leucine-rich repeat domain-containing protein [Muribaculaceae bacterium]